MPTYGWAGTEREKPVASGNVNWTQEYSHSHPAGGSGPWPALPGTPCWLIQEGGGQSRPVYPTCKRSGHT